MTDTQPVPELPLVWRVHLAARHPRKAALAVAFVAGTVLCAYLGFRNWVLCAAAALLLFGSVSDFLLPVTYRLDAEGAHVIRLSGASSLEWSRVRRCYQDPEGVKLSPFRRPSRLERWRGVYLRFQDNEEVVIALVKKLATNRATPQTAEATA